MNTALVQVNAKGEAREHVLSKLPMSIGRSEECRVRIIEGSVSRNHCELLIDDEELVVRDLKSSNGTFVNGQRIRQRELAPGDLLAVGPFVFVVRIDGHPQQIDAAASYAAGSVAPVSGGGAPIAGVPSFSGMGEPRADARTGVYPPAPGKARLAETDDDSKFELDLDLDDDEQ